MWRYFIKTTLLVMIHILCTQKLAAGFTEPAVTDYICAYGEYLCRNIYTPSVAATSFFTGEVEIFDFVVR